MRLDHLKCELGKSLVSLVNQWAIDFDRSHKQNNKSPKCQGLSIYKIVMNHMPMFYRNSGYKNDLDC